MEQEHLEKLLQSAQSLKDTFENANIQLVNTATEFHSPVEGSDLDDVEHKDPALVMEDVAAQTSYLRKLKFQYLEQNAKDRYIKSIVSDIDDAPIVSDDDNRRLKMENTVAKDKLKLSKAALAEVQSNIRTLAPLVEDDYIKVKKATEQAAALEKKILDARLALSRLRQTHPHPRLTVQSADQKLADQVVEMQSLTDEIEAVHGTVRDLKHTVKAEALEVEGLRAQRTELQKNLNVSRQDAEDDGRLIPLYDWYTASLALHRSIQNLHESHSASDNELRLTYQVVGIEGIPRLVVVSLIFEPNTRQLAAVQVPVLEEMGIIINDVLQTYIEANDVHGLIAAILSRARQGIVQ
ncbi:hypothetical protein C8J56DRAFT_815512, partial [Mycena floridula]